MEGCVDEDVMWGHIDAERAGVADMLEGLSPAQWMAPSLCDSWTIRDVAVHLTQAHMSLSRLIKLAVRSGCRFNTMTYRAAVEDSLAPEQAVATLRAMVGSRRKLPVAYPLIDVLIHAQDIAIPLAIERHMPIDAAIDIAESLWTMRFPANPRRQFKGVSLRATDCEFQVGHGKHVDGPIKNIVLVLAGRQAGLTGLCGAVDAIRFGA
jgi:uncharacterized protein (TIGR03083 family)